MKLLELFDLGLLTGTTHTYIGQEAVGVGIISALEDKDIIFSNHRCHGHFLAYCNETDGLMAEIMGKKDGIVGGRGGSQHIQYKNFYSNGIQGGIVPTATGMALAEKIKRTNAVTLVFLGDGTLGEGVVYESFNLASLWKLPIVFIVEDNRYAQTTPTEAAIAGEMVNRPKAFGIRTWETDSFDVTEINEFTSEIVSFVRNETRPAAFICHTYRFGPHSKGDDFRDKEEIDRWKQQDPISLFEKNNNLALESIKQISKDIDIQIERAVSFGKSSPFPSDLI